MVNKLDNIDLKILKALQENSKITNLELSKSIGLSPAPTLERVKKLEKTGVINSYHAKLNHEQMGLHVRTFVLVNLLWKKPNALENFIEKINSIDEVVEAYIVTGDSDLLLKIITADIPTYERLMFNTLSQIEEVERIKTLMTLSNVKESTILPFSYD
ncbi:MAG: Lrp/AsnC family transcriptional regulator [Saprospiraceae bacterium]